MLVISVLCLEDRDSEATRLREICEQSCKSKGLGFERVSSVAEAKIATDQAQYDVAIVDIQVPMRRGEAPTAQGGLVFLDYVLSSPHTKRPRYVIGITAEKDIFESAAPKFSQSLFAVVQRDPIDPTWEMSLTRFLGYLVMADCETSEGSSRLISPNVALAVICAVRTTELDAVKRWSGVDFAPFESPDDSTEYWLGTMTTQSGSHRILLAGAPEQGMPVAAAIAAKVIQKFRPRAVAMPGIAAATDSAGGFGDILIADQTWDHTTGKRTLNPSGEPDLLPENRAMRIDPLCVEQLRRLARDSTFINSIRDEWPARKPSSALRALCGPFASGGCVVETPEIKREILSRDRKTIAIDMEAHAIAVACWYATAPVPLVVIAKSTVDHGVPPKTSDWHEYAAYTSARFVAEWARRFL